METSENLKDSINQADIPQLLKDYLLRNEQVLLTFSTGLLNDIEDLYIEYDSLYKFDKAEFCSYVITGLKKQEKHEYFYNYLKIVVDDNVQTISKHITQNQLVLERMAENIKPKTDNLPNYIFKLYDLIDTYKESEDMNALLSAYQLTGILEVIFDIFPGNPYGDAFKKSKDQLENLSLPKQENKE